MKIAFGVFFCFSFSFLMGQTVSIVEIDLARENALKYLEKEQVKTTIDNKVFEGEWPAYMHMTNAFVLLGKSEKYRDSNCFNMTGIFNALSEAYLLDTTQISIKPMLEKAYPELITYKKDSLFNFWKLLPPNRDLSKKGTMLQKP